MVNRPRCHISSEAKSPILEAPPAALSEVPRAPIQRDARARPISSMPLDNNCRISSLPRQGRARCRGRPKHIAHKAHADPLCRHLPSRGKAEGADAKRARRDASPSALPGRHPLESAMLRSARRRRTSFQPSLSKPPSAKRLAPDINVPPPQQGADEFLADRRAAANWRARQKQPPGPHEPSNIARAQ